jgi:hypothetical protein
MAAASQPGGLGASVAPKGNTASGMGVGIDEPKRRRRFALPAHSIVAHPSCAQGVPWPG